MDLDIPRAQEAPSLDSPALDASPSPDAPLPTTQTLPDAAATRDAFEAALPDTVQDGQGPVLVAAGVLDAAAQQGFAPDAAARFTERVVGDPSLVEAATQYRDGGGAIPVDFPSLDGVEIARGRAQTVNGLGREQAADFTLISPDRQTDLASKAWNEFVLPYAHGDVYREYEGRNGQRRIAEEMPQLDYVDLKNILVDLHGRTDMTDIEKAFVWSTVADWKGVGGNWEYSDDSLHIDNRGVNPDLVDSHPGRAWNTPSHSVVPFHDPVHGFGALDGVGYIGYAYDDLDTARDRILQAETHVFGIVDNPGDANASYASTVAFHAWRDAAPGDRFAAFAATWIANVVDPAHQ